jgi:adenosylhomocysteine nucleosidase
MKLGIMGAMLEETQGIVDLLEAPVMQTIGGREYYSGRRHHVDCVVVFSRWGKVAAAASATTLLTHFGVDGILFVGVAGSVDPSLGTGDIVVADDLIQHDMDVSKIPAFQKFEVPLLGRSRFQADPTWTSVAAYAANRFVKEQLETAILSDDRRIFSIEDPKVVTGLVASGDRFIADAAYAETLREMLPDLRCVEMEGAALAQVCFEFEKPFVVIRIISDRADSTAPIDFNRFVSRVATAMSSEISDRFLQEIRHRDINAALSG